MTAHENRPNRSKFQRHVNTLIWKAYLQRQRRWRLLVLETLFASLLFIGAVFITKPVFLTPLQAEPKAPLTASDIIASLSEENILGYAPDIPPYTSIMGEASRRLGVDIMSALSEDDLNVLLYNRSRGTPIKKPVIWILWKPTENNKWKFSIRSTERARYVTKRNSAHQNPHLRSGFLAVQLAVSEAVLSYVSKRPLEYELSLTSMPISPLMQQKNVERAISGLLLCFVLALLPPVLEVEALVVTESVNRFKRSLRIRGVDYSTMYIGWLAYAYMTALPICVLASVTLILIFRWVHLLLTMILVATYITMMIMMALIMALFQPKAWIACLWTSLFTLMQAFLSELITYHRLDAQHPVLTFILQMIVPQLGLENGFNEFALLQTGRDVQWEGVSLVYTIVSWLVIIMFYFGILMLLQRTLKDVAIGGQVSWRSIIFKKYEDVNKLRYIETPVGNDREKLQEVDELVAKAISMRNVSKSVMGGPVLSNVTLDIYRGEFTMLYSERIQSKMLFTIEDLLTGLTYPDKGTINILGEELRPGQNLMSTPYMTGYCHRSPFLIDDLTVEEHLNLFCSICLWNESSDYVSEYLHMRAKRLLTDCDLEGVRHEYIFVLDIYYRAQLCWAIALLLEPRIVMIPSFSGNPMYTTVIKDKIMEYRGYITIIKLSYSSITLEYGDRVFIFDSRLLVFGGTPAYMFFKYGRDYRIRLTIRADKANEDVINELISKASEANATIRAHLGSLLILRLPTSPTNNVAAFVKYLHDNASKYSVVSMNISVPDSEEVCNRAIFESRSSIHGTEFQHELSKKALKNISEPIKWKRQRRCNSLTHLKYIAWKFFTFHANYRFYCIITVISALVAGIFIGISFAKVLADVERDRATKQILHGEVLTVESLEQKTILVLRLDNSTEATSLATAYVLSETNAKPKQIEKIHYTALSRPESLTEYLVTRAIDSPQQYVYRYAYGMDVAVDNGILNIQVLYSPLHHDQGAAARSLARAYMALIRHVTSAFDATIQVTDDPLALDLSLWLPEASSPPIFVQFLLILTISHLTLLPSMESGFIRHTQCHAKNSSPARYWFGLYFCDFIMYVALVLLITAAMVGIMVLVAPSTFYYGDLAVIPLLLTIYGMSCIPQAYIFSLGRRVALNTMTFMIVNILFGETTVVAKILYGDALSYVLHFMLLSPQFNMGYAFVKIKRIFLYNSECIVFERKNLCSYKTFHKCCPTCGILQECFSRKSYLSKEFGVLVEIIAMFLAAAVLTTMLLLWEYKFIQNIWKCVVSQWIDDKADEVENPGAAQERIDVINKKKELDDRTKVKIDTFGEYLLAVNVTQIVRDAYSIRNVYLGVGKGEALAISGLKDHGRQRLSEMLAGYKIPSAGKLWCMSKWRLNVNFHMYARQISYSCDHDPLPQWMTVYNGLELIAVLRGVPQTHVKEEIINYIDALELHSYVNTLIQHLPLNYRTRLHFAAALVGAPPVLVLEECTAYQKYSVRRAMYYILYNMRKRGHAVIMSSSNVESHLPVTNRLAILLEGRIFDVDRVDNLVERYSDKGYTVVVHVKDDVDVHQMFKRYFKKYHINDTSEVLINIQVFDSELNWASIFEIMETLQAENRQVYSYIITAVPIDNVYNTILNTETGRYTVEEQRCPLFKYIFYERKKVTPSDETLQQLRSFEKRYSVTQLNILPWSVIFQR